MESMKISLAGDLGSGKSTVGRIIGEKCGLEFYSTGTIQRKIALERGMTTYELNRYMEDHPEIDDEIDNGLKELENSDKNLVIDSRLAWHFVPSSFAVYMTTMSEISARRIMNAKRDSEPFAEHRRGDRVHQPAPRQRKPPLPFHVRRGYQKYG